MAVRGFHVLCTERRSCYSCGLGPGPFGGGEGVFLAIGAFWFGFNSMSSTELMSYWLLYGFMDVGEG